jgi:hypothetical protein
MKIIPIVSALLGGVIGFAVAGFGAAAILVSAFGSHDGGPAMSGFFGFGPIGGIAGALLGAGIALRFGSGSSKWGRGLMIGGGVVTVLGGLALAASMPDRRPTYSNVIEFELEYPSATISNVEIPSSNAMWGAGGGDADDHPISQFFEKKCTGDVCVLNGSVAALGPMTGFRITTAIGPKKSRYPLGLPEVITVPVDWSDWRQGDGARFRWRIVKR